MIKDKEDKSDKQNSDLDELRQEYDVFRKKYDLPDFTSLNKLFDIEDVDINTEFLLRKVRRIVYEKILNYFRFIEVIINPTNASLFFFKMIKKLDSSDMEELSEIYDNLGKFEIEIVKLDLDYNEKNEAEFIKKSFELFNEKIRKKLIFIINKILNHENNLKKKNNGSYFG